jgi:glycerophosphoryl diester phosphodiesterase
MMGSRVFERERPLIMAHRGDSAAVPENSMLSLRGAIEIGVDLLETDLQLTKDREFVLFHDDDLVRTTGQKGRICDYTLEELLNIDVGYTFTLDEGETFPFREKGLRLLTLRDAFAEFPDMLFNLDIKDKDPEAPSLLAKEIRSHGREDSVIVASFHNSQIEQFRKEFPTVASSAHPGEVKRFIIGLKLHVLRWLVRTTAYSAFQVPIKHGKTTVVNSRFVQAAHDRDIAVHVWTINDAPTMKWLVNLGVDGIFTDEPELLRRVLQESGFL